MYRLITNSKISNKSLKYIYISGTLPQGYHSEKICKILCGISLNGTTKFEKILTFVGM